MRNIQYESIHTLLKMLLFSSLSNLPSQEARWLNHIRLSRSMLTLVLLKWQHQTLCWCAVNKTHRSEWMPERVTRTSSLICSHVACCCLIAKLLHGFNVTINFISSLYVLSCINYKLLKLAHCFFVFFSNAQTGSTAAVSKLIVTLLSRSLSKPH